MLHLAFRKPLTTARFILVASLGMAAMVFLWHHLALGSVSRTLFPTPLDVLRRAGDLLVAQPTWSAVGATTLRVLLAFAAASAIAIPLGMMMSSWKVVDALFSPLAAFLRYVPVPALVPLFVLLTGIAETPKFLVLFFGTFFQMLLLVRDDANHVPTPLFEMARTLGAKPVHLIRDILWPSILPQICDRMRISLGLCWSYVIIAELVAADKGLGRLIKEAQRFNAVTDMLVYCALMGVIGLVSDWLAERATAKSFPYLRQTEVH